MSTKTNISVLKAEPREKLGTRAARVLRAEGRIPGTIGADADKPHVDLAIDEAEFMAARRQHSHVYSLEIGGAAETALVRHLDWDVFGDRVNHIEFRRVDLKKKTEVEVELAFVGHPKGVLNHLMTHVLIRALPTDIPDSIECTVADLEIGAIVTVGSLKMPANVELLTKPDLHVARISELKVDLGPAPEAAAPTAEAGTAAAAPAAGAAGATPAAGAAGAKPEKGAAPAAEKKGDKGGDKK